MKRRNFILSALLAIPAASLAKFNFLKKDISALRAKKGFLIRADESRFSGEQKKVGNDLLRCIVSCEDNETNLLIGTTTAKSLAGKGGPPLHVHMHQDEILFVASGELSVRQLQLIDHDNSYHYIPTGQVAKLIFIVLPNSKMPYPK